MIPVQSTKNSDGKTNALGDVAHTGYDSKLVSLYTTPVPIEPECEHAVVVITVHSNSECETRAMR